MRPVDIIGAGLGPDTLTRQADQLMARAEVLIGSHRLLAEQARPGQATLAADRPDQVTAAVLAQGDRRVVVLMSGDVGFHSGATKVAAALRAAGVEVRLTPGIATPLLLAARVGVPWQDACLVSCHGQTVDLVARVRRHRHTIALTGGNIPQLAAALTAVGYGGLTVWAGQNLGLADELVAQTTVEQLAQREWSPLTSLLIDNPDWDDRVLCGLPDDRFERGEAPMTKSAVRALVSARLALRPDAVAYDIGCGTGSVTVEMALAAHRGQIYAVDRDPAAVALTKQNCRAFHLANVTVVQGLAPAALADWPDPEAVFIGGAAGRLDEIVAAVVARRPGVQVVVTAIAVETVAAAVQSMTAAGLYPQFSQLSVAQGRPAGLLHLLMAQNPITVISGGGRVWD
ncbi:MAG: precorrin-6Y C5,15-methyltransferase (decarboxylating) subunit CbiT [Propionibacteriaceae bacterium]|jgi:precorrin-6Y C5,15-methyltransferase (decarboxylating)|nr:precorrin-6Y C5,15-methyltransferase (decarboxylating) subunit CbiT [Propionibacteriaceae bacterium]